jgi:phosphopantetheinyl transferase (holo-ACP synthase)
MSSFEQLTEFVDNRGATLAVEEGVIRGVKILGLESKNGRTYLKEAVTRAMPLYEGVKVNVDHPAGDMRQMRSYGSRIGVIENVRMGEGNSGLFGDFKYNPEHALAKQLKWDAENAPANVGFSHMVGAKIKRRGIKSTVVEEITRVQSVDLVADPATTRGLFEATIDIDSNTGGADMSEKELTLEGLKADYPSLVEQIAKDAVEASDASAERAAEKIALKEALQKVDGYELKDKVNANVEAVKVLIEESKLPKVAVTEDFLGQLMEADDEKRVALIKDRQQLIESVSKGSGTNGGKPMSKEQHTTEGDDSSLAGMTTEQIGNRWKA